MQEPTMQRKHNTTDMFRPTPLRGDAPPFYPSDSPHASRESARTHPSIPPRTGAALMPPPRQYSHSSKFDVPLPFEYARPGNYPPSPAAFARQDLTYTHAPPPPPIRPIAGPLQPPRQSRPFSNISAPPPSSSRLQTYSRPAHHTPHRLRHTNNRHPAARPQPQCAFLTRLPGEIRNRIYKLALISPEPIRATKTIIHKDTTDRITRSSVPIVPALAQTCVQIRHESLGVYYGGNAFVFEPESGYEDWVGSAVPKENVHGWVRCVTASGFERAVSRVGCMWKRYETKDGKCVRTTDRWVVATLGDEGGSGLQVKFETDLARWENVCERCLARVAVAFERRRAGKRLRGYGGLIDAVLTVVNYLGPLEAGSYPKCCEARRWAKLKNFG